MVVLRDSSYDNPLFGLVIPTNPLTFSEWFRGTQNPLHFGGDEGHAQSSSENMTIDSWMGNIMTPALDCFWCTFRSISKMQGLPLGCPRKLVNGLLYLLKKGIYIYIYI